MNDKPHARPLGQRLRTRSAIILAGAWIGGLGGGCHRATTHPCPQPDTRKRLCPAERAAPPRLPRQRPEHALAEFWLAQFPDPDRPLVDQQEVTAHNTRVAQLAEDGWPIGRWDLLARPVDRSQIAARLAESAAHTKQQIDAGKLVPAPATATSADVLSQIAAHQANLAPVDQIRWVVRPTALRCVPTRHGLFEGPTLLAFDFAQCSRLHYGQAVRVLAQGEDLWYVWAPFATGWVDPAALSPPLDDQQAREFVHPRRFVVVTVDGVCIWSHPEAGHVLGVARLGQHLPLDSGRPKVGRPTRVIIPGGPRGTRFGWIRDPSAIASDYLPLTRRELMHRAFSLLHTPYGWGGMGDHRDCSRMLMDLMATFGLLLPRNSTRQAMAGLHRVDVSELDPTRKAQLIEKAAMRAIVLLYMRGHIMLYVGRDGDHLFALHQFSGYLTPCSGGGETMNRVNRTEVTTLELGLGSSRGSFLQRISQLIVFGPAPEQPTSPSSPPDAQPQSPPDAKPQSPPETRTQ